MSYPSLKPFSSYFDDLLERVTCSTLGIETENHPLCFGYLVSSSQSFLTAALQNCTKHKLPVDEIAFDFEPIEGDASDITEPPEDGVYVSGLFLKGADGTKRNATRGIGEKRLALKSLSDFGSSQEKRMRSSKMRGMIALAIERRKEEVRLPRLDTRQTLLCT